MKTYLKGSLLALTFAACAATTPQAHAQFLSGIISVDFNSNNGGNNTDASAGPNAVITPGTWNELTVGTSGGPTTLNLSTGSASNVSLTYTASGSFDVIPYLTPTEIANSPNLGLLRDFLYNTSTTTPQTVTLTGLSASTPYNLYLYVGGNSNGRQTVFTIGTTSLTATFADADTTFVNGDNYVAYTGVTSSAAGTIAINYFAGTGNEGDFDGLQITPVAAAAPEPSSVALTGLGGVAMAGFVLRRQRRARA